MKYKLKLIVELLKKMFLSPEAYAKSLGVKFGRNCVFYGVVWSSEPYLIEVGNNCQITSGVKIFTHGGSHMFRGEFPEYDCFGKVIIGNNVYIGNSSMIMPGVTIGDNVLIAAGSVVTKCIPSNVCIGGNPAKVLSTIEDFRKNNIMYNLNTAKLNQKQKKQKLLNTLDLPFIKKKGL
jgi:acetyltransferase-like isoleucine patch superfamily enzyme